MDLATFMTAPLSSLSWQTMVAELPPEDLNLTSAQVAAKVLDAQNNMNRLDVLIGMSSGGTAAGKLNRERLYWETRVHALQYANSAAWAARYDVAAIDTGDAFSRIGDTVVSLVPTALKIAVAVAGADIVMAGTLITGAAAPAVAATGTTTAATAATTTADVIAQMTGAGVGVSDATAAAVAASAPGVASSATAVAEVTSASWGTLATGAVNPVLPVITSLPSTPPPSPPAPPPPPPPPMSAPSVPSVPSAPIIETLYKVAPTVLETAAQVAIASYAPAKPAQAQPQTAPEVTQYDNTNFYLTIGAAGIIVAIILLKMKG